MKQKRFRLPPLPYADTDLEPAFSARTLKLHHGQIFQSHIDALNIALDGYPLLQNRSAASLLTDNRLPRRQEEEILWHAGAVYCHDLYFRSMKACCGGFPVPTGKLQSEIRRDIGSCEGFCFSFREAAEALRGPGFLFLVRETSGGRWKLLSMRDYRVPDLRRVSPLLCMDLWEHAYFNEYASDRGRVVNAFLSVINWQECIEKTDS